MNAKRTELWTNVIALLIFGLIAVALMCGVVVLAILDEFGMALGVLIMTVLVLSGIKIRPTDASSDDIMAAFERGVQFERAMQAAQDEGGEADATTKRPKPPTPDNDSFYSSF